MNIRRIILLGFLVILLIGIPLTIYVVQKQQETRSRAQKSTTLSFAPNSSTSNPIKKNIGDSIPLDVMVNPGTNLVSFVKLEIDYDPAVLSVDQSTGFQANTAVFPSVLEGPVFSPGKIAVTLSVGPDPTKAVQSTQKAATVTFKATANTSAGSPTTVSYGVNTQVLSIGSSDQASENVLSSTTPATIVIGVTTSLLPTATLVPSATTAPTTGANTPTLIAQANTPTPTTASNEAPVCSSLTLDRNPSGTAPFPVTFTVKGSDSDGTIVKQTFTYGDGGVDTITSGGGLGTSTLNSTVAHTYTTAGTFTASVILTDNDGAFSASQNCTLKVTVTSGSTSVTNTPTPTTASSSNTSSGTSNSAVANATNTPTLAASGSTTATIGLAGLVAFLIIGGGLLFFLL